MTNHKKDMETDTIKQGLATEVLELGEMLFDTMIEAAAQRSPEGEAVDVSLIEEMQAAAEEYFTALRLLLKLEQPAASPDTTSTLGDTIPQEQANG